MFLIFNIYLFFFLIGFGLGIFPNEVVSPNSIAPSAYTVLFIMMVAWTIFPSDLFLDIYFSLDQIINFSSIFFPLFSMTILWSFRPYYHTC